MTSVVTLVAADPGAPLITGISPNHSSLIGGVTVTLQGIDLTPMLWITLNGVRVTPISSSPTAITVLMPPRSTAGVATLRIFGFAGASNNAHFVYANPTVSATSLVEPGDSIAVDSAGWLSGDALTVQLMSPDNVALGAPIAAPADPTGAIAGIMVPVTGTASSGTYTVTVSNASTTVSAPVVVDAAPTLTNLSPAFGPAAGGTAVTVTGTRISPSTVVTVGGVVVPASDVVVHSSTSLTFTTPTGATGNHAVTISNGVDRSGALPFEYRAAPIAPPTSTEPQALAATGTDLWMPLLSAVVLLTVGGALVTRVRRSNKE